MDIEDTLRKSAGDLVALDLAGITFLGYSYAKGTFVPAVKMVSSGVVEGTRVVAVADDGLSLEELNDALEKFDLAIIVLKPGDESTADGQIVGKLPEHLRATWGVIAEAKEATTADVAERIEESLQNTNQRLKKLDGLGLIRREKVLSPSGGWEWMNKVP